MTADIQAQCRCRSVEPWPACCNRPTRYERNHRRTGPIQNDLTIKQNYNSKTVDDLLITIWTLKRKKQHVKKWLKIPTHRRKIWIRKINYDAVEMSLKKLKISGKISTRSTSASNAAASLWVLAGQEIGKIYFRSNTRWRSEAPPFGSLWRVGALKDGCDSPCINRRTKLM